MVAAESGRYSFPMKSHGIAVVLAAAALVAGCGGTATTAAGKGTLAVQLTDAPFPATSLRSIDVFLVRVDARKRDADSTTADEGAADDSASTGGWTTLATPYQSVNLLAWQHGASMLLGNVDVAIGSYRGFRLVIDPARSTVTLRNGKVLNGTSTPSITFPDAARGIKIVLARPVRVAAGRTTTVLVDFIVGSSFVMRGNSIEQDGLLFTPVLRGSVRQ
jgi:hypothetical protein